MTDQLDLEGLESAATAATPGPWTGEEIFHPIPESGDGDFSWVVRTPSGNPVVEIYERYGRKGDDRVDYEHDARFIAAWNPATALSILSRLRASEAECAALRASQQVAKEQAETIKRLERIVEPFAALADALDDADDLVEDEDRKEDVEIIFGGMTMGSWERDDFRNAKAARDTALRTRPSGGDADGEQSQ